MDDVLEAYSKELSRKIQKDVEDNRARIYASGFNLCNCGKRL